MFNFLLELTIIPLMLLIIIIIIKVLDWYAYLSLECRLELAYYFHTSFSMLKIPILYYKMNYFTFCIPVSFQSSIIFYLSLEFLRLVERELLLFFYFLDFFSFFWCFFFFLINKYKSSYIR